MKVIFRKILRWLVSAYRLGAGVVDDECPGPQDATHRPPRGRPVRR